MRSWDALPDAILKPAADVTRAFFGIGVRDYRAAARHLNHLPYGRNSSRTETLAVLREGHGTCSTKHALLKELAIEQKLEVALVIGIYEMTERNTPGVGRVLEKYRLAYMPEAHCYLRYREDRVDVTRALADGPSEPIARFLHEEEIVPPQVGDYKVGRHQSFIREECIAALSA
ncbi:MAG: hypothetical protein ACLQAT_16690 [Candidatus Binataceae bacterium]